MSLFLQFLSPLLNILDILYSERTVLTCTTMKLCWFYNFQTPHLAFLKKTQWLLDCAIKTLKTFRVLSLRHPHTNIVHFSEVFLISKLNLKVTLCQPILSGQYFSRIIGPYSNSLIVYIINSNSLKYFFLFVLHAYTQVCIKCE